MKTLLNLNSKPALIRKAFIIPTLAAFLFACRKDAANTSTVDCSGPAKSFATDVNPIIQSSCSMDSDCHGSGSHSGPGELMTYSQIFNARSAIQSAVASGFMPLDGSLSTSEKNTILCWIDNGAADN
jgi:hypothetical protein